MKYKITKNSVLSICETYDLCHNMDAYHYNKMLGEVAGSYNLDEVEIAVETVVYAILDDDSISDLMRIFGKSRETVIRVIKFAVANSGIFVI